MAPRDLVPSTLAALAAPRRLVPILVVCVPMVVAQGSLSRHVLAAPLGAVMCLAFVVTAPLAYRGLFPPEDKRPPLTSFAARGLVYLALGAIFVIGLGVVVPRVVDMGRTFLTADTSILINLALFYVGGWGLGRDIDLEIRLSRAHARADALSREAERAQLLALRSHLDPHFLFNTLNAIAEWCREDGEVAERAIVQLSSVLRTVMDGVRAPSWPLAREIELADAVLALHGIRDPGRFTLRREVAAKALDTPVLPMILLPLVENAMKHGPGRGHRGECALVVREEGDRVKVRIENPGAFGGPRDGGTGLAMIERRLALAYGIAARVSVRGEGERTVAELEVPRRGPSASEAS